MAAWREEDHPRDERGRFTVKGMQAAASIRRTIAHPQSADDSALLDVFGRIGAKKRLSRRDIAALESLDAELARREAGGEPAPTPEQVRVDQLVAGGASWDDAYREAYGREGDHLDDDSDRQAGETREQMRRRQFTELTYITMLQAEDWCNGHMLTKEGESLNMRVVTLFSGPRARAEKYASEELRRFWTEVQPRMTYAEYRAERVGDATGARKAREARRTATNGKDFAA